MAFLEPDKVSVGTTRAVMQELEREVLEPLGMKRGFHGIIGDKDNRVIGFVKEPVPLRSLGSKPSLLLTIKLRESTHARDFKRGFRKLARNLLGGGLAQTPVRIRYNILIESR